MQRPEQLTQIAISLGGLPILGCSHDSPAARGGLRYGDIVLTVNGSRTQSWAAFLEASARTAERPLRLQVLRQGQELQLSLSLPRAARTPRAVLEAVRPARDLEWS